MRKKIVAFFISVLTLIVALVWYWGEVLTVPLCEKMICFHSPVLGNQMEKRKDDFWNEWTKTLFPIYLLCQKMEDKQMDLLLAENQNAVESTESQSIMQSETTEITEVIEPVEEPQIICPIDWNLLHDFTYLTENIYQIDSSTTADASLLSADKFLAFDATLAPNVEGPQVLIYHTHSQETYVDSVAGDSNTSVVGVGDYLTQLLTEKGISVLHHKGEYDVGDRDHAYSNAAGPLQKILEENPSIEVVIDLHRDGVADTTHLVTEIDGRPTAKIMFFNGLCRTREGELSQQNPYLDQNLALSFQMQLAANQYYPGLTRRIYLKAYRYNMEFCPKSMLIEVGAQTNTVLEAKNAMIPLAEILSKVLQNPT